MKTEYKIVALAIVLGLFVWGIDVGLMALNVSGHSFYIGLIALTGFLALGLLTSKFLAGSNV